MRTLYKAVSWCKCDLRHDLLDKNIALQIQVITTRIDAMDKALELHTQAVSSKIQGKIYIVGVVVGAVLVILEILMNFIKI